MGLFSVLMGNAGSVSRDELPKKYGQLMIEGEEIELGFKLVRDTFLVTNKRLILVNIEGLTGSKTKDRSVTCKSSSRFRIKTAGILNRDAELRIRISSEV